MLEQGVPAWLIWRKCPTCAQLIPPLLVGFVTAFIFGYIAIRWLIAYLTRHSLYIFAAYCAVVGLLILRFG